MSSGKGLYKMHHAIMKIDAQADYDVVKSICKELSLPIIIPKGKSAWKIEDATAEMIKAIPPTHKMILRKGISYYASIIKP